MYTIAHSDIATRATVGEPEAVGLPRLSTNANANVVNVTIISRTVMIIFILLTPFMLYILLL